MDRAARVTQQNEHNNRKMILGIVALVAAVIMIIGAGFAFFSDVITGEGEAAAGTLDISGTIEAFQNSDTTPASDNNITNLNPGDVISFAGDIENLGTKSAWIRQIIQFTTLSDTDNVGGICSDSTYTNQADCEDNSETWTAGASEMTGNLADYIWVCTTTTADTMAQRQTKLIAASMATGGFSSNIPTDYDCAQADTTGVFGEKTTYALETGDVVSGTIEVENDGTNNLPATWAAASAPFIYFDALAGNEAQNGTMEFSVLVQALQYRNNTTSPDQAAWETVVSTPFATL